MTLEDVDADIIQDFLTESRELLDALDSSLVDLESDPENPELLNSIFRALHTIKGSSGFLGLDTVTEMSHASEDLLNKLRNAELTCSEGIITAILDSVDVLKGQIEQVGDGETPDKAPDNVLSAVKGFISGETPSEAPAPAATESAAAEAQPDSDEPFARTKLELDSSKQDLVEYMAKDLSDSIGDFAEHIEELHNPETRAVAANELKELAGDLLRSVGFFDLAQLTAEIQTISDAVTGIESLDEDAASQIVFRLQAIMWIMQTRVTALEQSEDLTIPSQQLIDRVHATLKGDALDADAVIPDGTNVEAVLAIDGILTANEPEQPVDQAPAAEQAPKAEDKPKDAPAQQKAAPKASAGDQTIRVDVDRLEALLNLVGELVLQKNRVLSFSRTLTDVVDDHDTTEAFSQVASDLDRITGELQLGVMKTRLQPLNKLFSRYPRVIRDLSRATDKQIDLNIEGGDTEVDKSVIELLADPMVHIMRNSADHGIEMPADREAAGKSSSGTITIAAEHQGSHVVVSIIDDGRGIDPEIIGGLIVKKGLATPEEVAAMTDNQIIRHVFAPGFSTASNVSDLSGRGVGMDVVNTNIAKLNGVVDIHSAKGEGTTVKIKIPLTLAIMQAMMIDVNDAVYAVPLTNILEIVKPDESTISTIRGRPVLRLRDEVVPLIDMSHVLPFGSAEPKSPPFVVTVGVGTDRAGLMVHGLLGQQDIVIKPLNEIFKTGGAVSGATVREDGCVSMILDVATIICDKRYIASQTGEAA